MTTAIRIAVIMGILFIFQAVIEAIFDLLVSNNIEVIYFHNSILETFRVNDIITMIISYGILSMLIKVVTK